MLAMPLIELTPFCRLHGYEVYPVSEGKKFKAMLFFQDDFVKFGKNLYDSSIECEGQTLNKIYNAIT